MSPARLALIIAAIASVVLIGIALITDRSAEVLSWAFTLLPIGAWLMVIVLYLAHRSRPEATNLGERVVVAARDAVVATIGAALGLNRLLSLQWPNSLALALLALALLLVTAYPLAWLIQWWRGRFD